MVCSGFFSEVGAKKFVTAFSEIVMNNQDNIMSVGLNSLTCGRRLDFAFGVLFSVCFGCFLRGFVLAGYQGQAQTLLVCMII